MNSFNKVFTMAPNKKVWMKYFNKKMNFLKNILGILNKKTKLKLKQMINSS